MMCWTCLDRKRSMFDIPFSSECFWISLVLCENNIWEVFSWILLFRFVSEFLRWGGNMFISSIVPGNVSSYLLITMKCTIFALMQTRTIRSNDILWIRARMSLFGIVDIPYNQLARWKWFTDENTDTTTDNPSTSYEMLLIEVIVLVWQIGCIAQHELVCCDNTMCYLIPWFAKHFITDYDITIDSDDNVI